MDLADRRFLVTGVASGIGRQVASDLSRRGAKLVCIDRDEAALSQAMASFSGSGHESRCFDLREIDGIPELMTSVLSVGTVYGMVHAAGLHSIHPVRLLDPSRYKDLFAINTEAALALARAICHRKNNPTTGGSIVFVASVMASVGSAGAVAYGMSKAALIGLTKSLAIEMASHKIRVNCVAPGFVKTPMYERVAALWTEEQRKIVEAQHPLGIGEPADVAEAVLFLLADSARWITGSVLVVDGGYTAQ